MFSLRKTVKTLSSAALATAVLIVPAQAAQAFNCSDAHVVSVVNATNDYRTANGLKKVNCDNHLTAESQEWAETMRDTKNFDHDPNTRTAENIAYYGYQPKPGNVVQDWIDSPGHRANVLDKDAEIIGVGWAQDEKKRTYAVQRFW
ncbi:MULTISPECIES: CAP domain-containing protein [unclassified Corynebacterium]|uniref:CAP domain-containing protein n=1 Tax=unclassified Corynebacterium TaxID=2624378 RepID=UPI0029CA1C13|nr:MULTISPECIES: CAP domain-containing protein [unclassified Corynebacterium]WPF65894.1 CAP domain-containing protein [Corynebacterium sp. 22KM0430]WPF68387.1 CAP domain-containing protein [Corynebacterium sp. 21KM1197]